MCKLLYLKVSGGLHRINGSDPHYESFAWYPAPRIGILPLIR